MARAAITARRRLQRLLVHPVGKRPSSNSRADRKARRAYKHECKQAWKAQKKAA